MNDKNINEHIDTKLAVSCADTYHCSTGIKCFVIDSYGNDIHNTGKCECCELCVGIHEKLGWKNKCRNVHLYGSYQAERFGGQYIYFCPMGLVHWAAPIGLDGMQGSLVGGPVHMMEPEVFLMDEIIGSNEVPDELINRMYEYINKVPIVTPEKVKGFAETLYIFSNHVAGVDIEKYRKRDFFEFQCEISQFVHSQKKLVEERKDSEFYPFDKEKELMSYIQMGDKENSQKILNEILGHIFFCSSGKFDTIKMRVLELLVLLSRASLEGGADIEQVFGLNYKYLAQINDFNRVEELTYWLSKIMVRFTDCVFNLKHVKHKDVIYKAVDYIKRNYMSKITLDDVASYVNLSPSYFCRVFKEEMKYNFNAYLNKVRIDVSMKMLLSKEISLIEISSLVGFEDQSYFSKVFKKLTGVSPGRYRESRGHIKQERIMLNA